MRRLHPYRWLLLGLMLSVVNPATSAEIPRIAVLLPEAAVASLEVGLREGFREQGYVEGRDIVIEWRHIGGSIEDARPHVAELVRSKVALILAPNTSSARAAMETTSTIPIVFVSADPVATGLVRSMARPGGNATGVSVVSPELVAKRLDLLHQVLPHVRRNSQKRRRQLTSSACSWKRSTRAMPPRSTRRCARSSAAHLGPFSLPATCGC